MPDDTSGTPIHVDGLWQFSPAYIYGMWALTIGLPLAGLTLAALTFRKPSTKSTELPAKGNDHV